MKKPLLKLVLILTMLVMISKVSFAEGDIVVRIDSEPVVFTESTGAAFIDNNSRTLVPLRITMETYGSEVEWNSETRTAIVKKDDITVEVPLGQKYILINGQQKGIDTQSIIKGDRTYLPIRAVVEALGSEVEWDKYSKTVVITSEPIDAKKALLDAYAKSYEWKNYDMEMLMHMVMPGPDEAGNIVDMHMSMNMDMTTFTDPMKVKATADMSMDMGETKINQPVMEMYMTLEEDKFTQYIGMYDEAGQLTWMKSVEENEIFSELMDMEKNKELNEQSIKDVKYLGDYLLDGKVVQKFENTTSFEAYNEIMGGYMNILSASGSQSDMMTAEMLMNLEDIVFVIYVDKATGEIASYEMDLSSFMQNMLLGMSEDLEVSKEELKMLKSLKMLIQMDVMNINKAKDFEIPKEALEAPLLEDLMPIEE